MSRGKGFYPRGFVFYPPRPEPAPEPVIQPKTAADMPDVMARFSARWRTPVSGEHSTPIFEIKPEGMVVAPELLTPAPTRPRPRSHPRPASRPLKQLNSVIAKYGLTLDDYDTLILRAEGRCEMCAQMTHRLNIDHCHETGVVRGLLCMNCNVGLGRMGDTLERAQQAVAYLSLPPTSWVALSHTQVDSADPAQDSP